MLQTVLNVKPCHCSAIRFAVNPVPIASRWHVPVILKRLIIAADLEIGDDPDCARRGSVGNDALLLWLQGKEQMVRPCCFVMFLLCCFQCILSVTILGFVPLNGQIHWSDLTENMP
jgi:hypothetical protein